MSVTRAVGLLGIGTANLRLVPLVPGEFRMDVAALQAMVTNDRAAGKNPICLVGGAGSGEAIGGGPGFLDWLVVFIFFVV